MSTSPFSYKVPRVGGSGSVSICRGVPGSGSGARSSFAASGLTGCPGPRRPQAATRSSRRAISDFGCTPTMRSISRPSLRTSRVGMLRTLKRVAVAGFSSTLSFANRTRPAICAASSSRTGATMRHGPHHGAHISSTTGSGERSTSAENVASVTVTGPCGTGSGALHRPHTGCSPRAIFSCGTRLVAPQAGQRIKSVSAMRRPRTRLVDATARLDESLAKVLAGVFQQALALRDRPAERPGELGAGQAVDITEQQGSSPLFRHPRQRRAHAQTHFYDFRVFLGRRDVQVRKHVLELQVLVRLVEFEDLLAEPRHPLGRRRVRNVGLRARLDALTPRPQSLDLGGEVLAGQPDEPAPDLSLRRVLDELAIRAKQHGVHHVVDGQLARHQVADRLEVT